MLTRGGAPHWNDVYSASPPATSSWYQATPSRSLQLILASGAGAATAIIDVGGGDSTLVDALLDRQWHDITVLDISRVALQRARARLGTRAYQVTWIESDITSAELPTSAYDVWHDRAVFHFLTDASDRATYAEAAMRAVRRGGALVIATFAPDAPPRCSGLAVARYDAWTLAGEFAEAFRLESAMEEMHRTPAGAEQPFTYVVLRRR